MSLELKRFLLNSYGHFVEKTVKGDREEEFFKIDDAKDSDKGPAFCRVYVRVTGFDQFLLWFTNLPMNHEVEQLVISKGGEICTEHSGCQVSLSLETTDFQFVLQLSELVRVIVAPGRTSSGRDYKWICSRTADSLHRFAALLRQYEKQTSGMEKTRPDGLFAF